MLLENLGVTDGLGPSHDLVATDPGKLTVQPHILPLGKILLFLLELERHVEQTIRFSLIRHGQLEKRQMVPKEEHRLRVENLLIRSHVLLPQHRRHRRDVLMTEANIRVHKTFVTWPDAWNTNLALGKVDHPVPRDDFFCQRRRTRFGRNPRDLYLALEPRDVVLEQPPILDDPAGYVALALREFAERNLFTGKHSFDEAEVGAREDTKVLAVLVVDALDTLRNH